MVQQSTTPLFTLIWWAQASRGRRLVAAHHRVRAPELAVADSNREAKEADQAGRPDRPEHKVVSEELLVFPARKFCSSETLSDNDVLRSQRLSCAGRRAK